MPVINNQFQITEPYPDNALSDKQFQGSMLQVKTDM